MTPKKCDREAAHIVGETVGPVYRSQELPFAKV